MTVQSATAIMNAVDDLIKARLLLDVQQQVLNPMTVTNPDVETCRQALLTALEAA